MRRVGIGVIGCGNISGIYLKNLAALAPTGVVACADLVEERAKAKAEEYGIPRTLTIDELLTCPEVEMF